MCGGIFRHLWGRVEGLDVPDPHVLDDRATSSVYFKTVHINVDGLWMSNQNFPPLVRSIAVITAKDFGFPQRVKDLLVVELPSYESGESCARCRRLLRIYRPIYTLHDSCDSRREK